MAGRNVPRLTLHRWEQQEKLLNLPILPALVITGRLGRATNAMH